MAPLWAQPAVAVCGGHRLCERGGGCIAGVPMCVCVLLQVVKALQVHFDEYRSTAEALFAAEASKLEDKLAVQSRK